MAQYNYTWYDEMEGESGMTDDELSQKHIGQLNFNTFSNINNKEIFKGYYSDEDGNKINKFILRRNRRKR